MSWVAATPKAGDGGFEKVRLGFVGAELRAMELADSFGQTTLIHFSVLPAALFKFTPPAGADVIGE